MRDPVTGFEYPDEWVAACRSPELLDDVQRGLAVLTASGLVLRRGFSTGTTAAAACKAAVLSLALDTAQEEEVRPPCGIAVRLPVAAYRGQASCWKDAGDYTADVTAGLEFVATAAPSLNDGAHFVPGEGIGSFDRDTPRHRQGTPAISATALECIRRSIDEAMENRVIRGDDHTHRSAGAGGAEDVEPEGRGARRDIGARDDGACGTLGRPRDGGGS